MSINRMGDSPKRREDAAFVTGRGCYLDDLVFDRLAHAVVVRSTHAHAKIAGMRLDEARAVPGVLAVLTSHDLARDGIQPLRPSVEANTKTGEPFAFLPQPQLAVEKVRYVGEPVVLIVAETKAAALDAADAVAIDYAPLPAMTTPASARAPDAPEIASCVPGNVCLDWRTGDWTRAENAFASARHVVSMRIDNHRIVTNPMEPRGAVGLYDPATGRYTLHVSSQNVHGIRDHCARSLGVAPEAMRLVAPDVGGNFGAKNFVYPEYVLMAWASRLTGRPVKWIASRSEIFLADHPARDQQAEAALALDADGRFLALRVESVANAGAYLAMAAGVQTFQYTHLPGTVYRIPAIALRISAVLTNTAPIGVTRGPGFAEAVNIIERLIDVAARRTGLDRAHLRRINMVPASEMPFTNVFGEKVDSGAFPETFEQALKLADVEGFAARRLESEANGKLRGLGFAYHIKGTGGFPHENADLRFESDGTVTLTVGTHSVGQGHATTFPQIVAERLGIDDTLVRFRQADTDLIPIGGGSGSSRSTYMGGTAIWRAADEIITKGTAIAVAMLEAPAADIAFADGHFTVRGTNRSVSLLDVARAAAGQGTPLSAYHRWTREWMTFPNGAHVVEVEIDRDTGAATLDRYTAVDDYGVLVNPMIVAGQVHGAIAQGVGQALLEAAVHDPESGQPVTGSFMDYALPRADHLPRVTLALAGTRCTTNPLGVKGAGEAGAIAAYPAIANAIYDALAPFGDVVIEGLPTAARIWAAMHDSRSEG
ncbi:MAG: xanthine dehydrogenase family protein molybdopterin-binding subunit [Hyphomicrobiaceae bacterium]